MFLLYIVKSIYSSKRKRLQVFQGFIDAHCIKNGAKLQKTHWHFYQFRYFKTFLVSVHQCQVAENFINVYAANKLKLSSVLLKTISFLIMKYITYCFIINKHWSTLNDKNRMGKF